MRLRADSGRKRPRLRLDSVGVWRSHTNLRAMHRGWSSAPEARARAVLCRARPSHTPGGTGPPSLLAAPRCQGPGNLLREGGVACPQPSGGVRHKRPGPRAHATRLSPTGTSRRAARPLHHRGCGARRRAPEGHVATQRAQGCQRPSVCGRTTCCLLPVVCQAVGRTS